MNDYAFGNKILQLRTQRKLSQTELAEMVGVTNKAVLMQADTTRRQIRKTRYCLAYKNQYFEIDVYPFWTDRAIAEIELSDENAAILFPKKIKVIREVTDDDSYKNASLARM